jgi:hypothetical protein
VDVNYENFVNDINVGDIVLVDNGEIEMRVVTKDHNKIECEVITPGKLGSRRHINLPGVKVSLPALTAKDLADIALGLELGVDYIALSFVREAKDIQQLKAVIQNAKTRPLIIAKIEDQEISLMEQTEAAQKQLVGLTAEANEAKKHADSLVALLGDRETNLKKELATLQGDRESLATAVDQTTRGKYERLAKSKGDNVLVGVQHGVCGGCHMKLPAQSLVACQSHQEIVTCINCGRILFYTRDMTLAATD